MVGRIKTLHLLTHAHTIIHEYGMIVYMRAWRVAFRGGTFLEVLFL